MKKTSALAFPTLALSAILIAAPAFADATPSAKKPVTAKKTTTVTIDDELDDSSAAPSRAGAEEIGNTTVTTTDSNGDKKTHSFGLLIYESFFGPSVSHASAYQPKDDGTGDDVTSPVKLRSNLMPSFALNDNLTLVSALRFDSTYTPTNNGDMTLLDPYVGIKIPKLVNAGNFTMMTELLSYLPWSQSAFDNNQAFGIRWVVSPTLNFTGSRFSLSAWTFVQANVFSNNEAAFSANDMTAYFGPSVNYQFTPTLAATLLYEMNANKKLGSQFSDMAHDDGTDLEPGLSWDITPTMNFNPYLNFTTGTVVNARSTSAGFNFSWKMI